MGRIQKNLWAGGKIRQSQLRSVAKNMMSPYRCCGSAWVEKGFLRPVATAGGVASPS